MLLLDRTDENTTKMSKSDRLIVLDHVYRVRSFHPGNKEGSASEKRPFIIFEDHQGRSDEAKFHPNLVTIDGKRWITGKIVVEEAVVELNHLSQSRVFNVRVVDKHGAKVAVAIWTGEQRPNELNIG